MEHEQLILFHVLGHEKVSNNCLFFDQCGNRSMWHMMSIGNTGGDDEAKIVCFYCNNILSLKQE